MSTSRLPTYLLLIGLLLSPLFFIPSVTIPFVFAKVHVLTLLSSLAFLIAVVVALRRRAVSLTFHPVLLALWTVVAAYLVSALLTKAPMLSLVGMRFDVDTVAFMALAAFSATLCAHLFSERRHLSLLLRGAAIVAALGGLFVGARLLFGVGFLGFGFFTDKTSNFFGSWNDLALLSGLSAILCLNALRSATLVGAKKVLVIVGLVASIFFLAITNYFTALLVVAVVSAAFFLLEMLSSIRARSTASLFHLFPIFALLTALVAGLFAFESGIGGSLATSVGISQLEARPSWVTTFDIGKATLNANPLFGSGPNTFVRDWLLNKPAEVNTTAFWAADFIQGVGTIPTGFITTGIVGTAFYAIFLLLLVLASVQFFVRSGQASGGSFYSTTFALAALYLVLFTFLYTPSPILVLSAYASVGLFIAALIAEGFLMKRQISLAMPTWGSYLMQLAMALAIITTVAYLGESGMRFIAALQAGQASADIQAGDVVNAKRHSASALSLAHVDEYERLAALANLAALRDLVNKKNPTDENKAQAQQELSEAVAHVTAAVNDNSQNYQNWLALAQVYITVLPLQVQGAYENAKTALGKAIELAPKNPDLELAFAQLELGQNNTVEGRKHLTNSLSLKGNYTAAIYLLAQLDIAEGKSDEALQALAVAQQLIPNEPSVYFMAGYLFYARNDDKNAIGALKEAVALNKDYANAHYFLGLALARSGDSAGAIAEFEGLAAGNPDNADVAAILKNLKAGKPPFAAQTQRPTKNSPLPIKGE